MQSIIRADIMCLSYFTAYSVYYLITLRCYSVIICDTENTAVTLSELMHC